MNSRERVYATLDFQGPDRLPVDLWSLPAAFFGREEAVNALLTRYPTDFGGVGVENAFDIGYYPRGTTIDHWGCEWLVLQEGLVGEVKHAPLEDYARLKDYAWPEMPFGPGWQQATEGLKAQQDRFTLGWVGDPFERMQFLRGTENLYVDLADEDCEEVYLLRDKVFAMMREYVERWARTPVNGLRINDDWGSQRTLLISPAKWREFFKPKYKEIFDIARDAGKRIFFHSDGYILDIYPDLIELGVSAINSQIWCMGLDALEPFTGKVTFWGELDRQNMLPFGKPADIRAAARQMAKALYRNGGLIGEGEMDHLTSLENIEAMLTAWGEIDIDSSAY